MERIELELEVKKRTQHTITYNITRKGLLIGLMVLDQPYNNPEEEKILLTMHNNILK